MATGGSDKDASGEADDTEAGRLMCAICLEMYRRPKLLPCFHMFCQSCLQGVAGSAPSLTCPSCDTFVMLPPGGVRALQTNLYIEGDLAGPTSLPQQRLCDVCTEDREATLVCFQCQQRLCSPCRIVHDGLKVIKGHTVMSLTQEEGSEKGGAAALLEEGPKPEMCPKHSDQRLLLHCKQCQGDICIQCKLTQHEGHPTEDLADTRSKARTTLEQLLEDVTQQRQQILHLVLALKDRCVQLQSQKQETEQSLRSRADTLFQWVNQSLAEAVTNLEKSAQNVEKAFQDQVELLEKKDAALQAQQDYVMRVLKEGSGGDLVPLEDQLSSSHSESTYLKQVEKELSKKLAAFRVQQGSSVLRQQVLEFVGVLKPVLPTPFPLQDFGPDSSVKTSLISDSVAKTDSEKKQTRKCVYSKNSESSVVAMCPISRSRLWVAYYPAKCSAVILKLFDAEGEVLATVNDLECKGLAALSDDTVLAWSSMCTVDIITPAGEISRHDLGVRFDLLIPSARNKHYMATGSSLREVQFTTGEPTVSEVGVWCFEIPPRSSYKEAYIYCRHVSCKGEYVAAIQDGVVKVYRTSAQGSVCHAKYIGIFVAEQHFRSLDVRFCFIEGREQMLVTIERCFMVHIVDHTDGCRFVCNLNKDRIDHPKLLATNFDQNVWVGCEGGTVAMIDL